jgi:hypothetical protein
MRLQLPNVTLICLTNKDFKGHLKAFEESTRDIDFGGAKIIFDFTCNTIDEWNRKIIYELPNYIDTEFALLIHADGYVIRPDLWRDEFLNYSYIGAPWPLPNDDYSYRDSMGNIQRVGNSVSIRSKKLMELIRTREWKSYYGNTNEDGFICCHHRTWLEASGCSFAPLEVAKHFSKEHEIPENVGLETFAFHSL